MMRNPKQTIGNLIDKANMAMLSYVNQDGFPISKAMLSPREREEIHTFWFTTNTSSNKVKYLRDNPKGSIYFVDKRFYRGVSLVGEFEVLETQEAKERIWKKGDTLYYKEGVTDPDYCVLKFHARKGSFYSNFSVENFDIEQGE